MRKDVLPPGVQYSLDYVDMRRAEEDAADTERNRLRREKIRAQRTGTP